MTINSRLLGSWIPWMMLVTGILAIGSFVNQDSFARLAVSFMVLFSGYFAAIKYQRLNMGFREAVLAGFILRFLLIYYFPSLSDDIYRYYWDGHLWLNSMNAYSILPAELIRTTSNPILIDTYPHLNSAQYFSVYPGVCQLIFTGSAALAGNDILLFSIILKIIFILADGLALWSIIRLLKHMGKPVSWSLWYFLNPLVILEGVGNLHFEIIMIPLIASALLYLFRKKIFISAIFLGLAVSTKLTPLIALPFIWKYLGNKDGLRYSVVCFIIISLSNVLLFDPDIISQFYTSIDLYFQTFEFNASFYYLLRWIGYQIQGWNWIDVMGPLSALIGLALIIRLWWNRIETADQLVTRIMLAYTIYLIFSTTVHPWYVITPFFFGVLVRARYTRWWTLIVMLSYHAYRPGEVHESMLVVLIEYVLLAILLLLEIKKPASKIDAGFLN